MKRSWTLAVAALAAFLSARAEAQTQTLYDSTILAAKTNFGGNWQVRPDGTGLQQIPYIGIDLSRVRFGDGRRYFLTHTYRRDANGNYVYDENGNAITDVIAQDENNATPRIIMQMDDIPGLDRPTSTGTFNQNMQWSPDGRHIYYPGWRYDVDGNLVEQGIYIGSVERDVNGRPYALTNERLAVPIPLSQDTTLHQTMFEITHLSMMADGRRIVFLIRSFEQVPGEYTHWFHTVHVATIFFDANQHILDAALPVGYTDVNISGPFGFLCSMASPVDDRVALRGVTDLNTGRQDLFTINLPASYAGEVLAPLRVTNPRNAKVLYGTGDFHWSPDGQYLAYEAENSGNGAVTVSIFRNKANGTDAQKALISQKNAAYRIRGWW